MLPLAGRPVLSRQRVGFGEVRRRFGSGRDLAEVGLEVWVLREEALQVGFVLDEDGEGVFGAAGPLLAGGLWNGGGRRFGRKVGGVVGFVDFGAGDRATEKEVSWWREETSGTVDEAY